MKRAVVRVLVVVASVTGLLAAPTPAIAQGTITVGFTASATLTAGFGSTCTNAGGPPNLADNQVNPGTKTCPPDSAIRPEPNKKGQPLRLNGNSRSGTLVQNTCTASQETTQKQNKEQTARDLNCKVTSGFVVTGYCDQFIVIGIATATINGQDVHFNYTGVGTGGVVVLRGNWWKGQQQKPPTPNGDLTATLAVLEDPADPGDCTTKTATKFIVGGTAKLVNPKVLP